MALYKTVGTVKRTRVEHESAVVPYFEVGTLPLPRDKYKTIVVLRDSEGQDHPANAGKFFLNQIIK